MQLATLGGHRMDNFCLGLQSVVPTLSQYFGTFNLTNLTAIVFNLFRDWIEPANMGGHRMDNFGLGVQLGLPTLWTTIIGGP